MQIKQIKATDYIEKAWDLLEEHRQELATYKHLMILKPDVDKYKILESQNKLISLAMFDDKEIVGYSVLILTNALHYSDLTIAQNDVLYLRKDLRKSKWGLALIRATENAAKDAGVKMIMWHGKENTPFSQLMPKLGYIVQDIMFSKEL